MDVFLLCNQTDTFVSLQPYKTIVLYDTVVPDDGWNGFEFVFHVTDSPV